MLTVEMQQCTMALNSRDGSFSTRDGHINIFVNTMLIQLLSLESNKTIYVQVRNGPYCCCSTSPLPHPVPTYTMMEPQGRLLVSHSDAQETSAAIVFNNVKASGF